TPPRPPHPYTLSLHDALPIFSEFAHISASSTSWHMKRLVEAGLVKARRQGSFVYYTAKGDPVKILTLLKSYHPRIWERWAGRLRSEEHTSELQSRGHIVCRLL